MASTEDGSLTHVEFASDEAFASYLVRRLEDKEAKRSGLNVTEVRPIVARRVGIAPGTLENLRRGRIKAIKKHVYEWLIAAADRELRAEIARLEHERAILAAQAGSRTAVDLGEVEAHLAAARAALGGKE